MKRTLFVVVAVISALCVFADTKDIGTESMAAACAGGIVYKPKMSGGNVEFNEEEDVVLEVSSKQTMNAKLRKIDAGPDNPSLASKKAEQSAVYTNEDMSVVCRKDCDSEGDCDQYCFRHEKDQVCFVSGGKAVCMDSHRSAGVDIVIPDDEGVQDSNSRHRNTSRSRRSIIPDLTTAGIIRINFHLDDAFMEVFKTIADKDVNGAKREATKFVKLAANEMTLMLQSFKEYEQTYTLGGATHELHFALYVAYIEFPQVSDNEFVSVVWSAAGAASLSLFKNYIADTYSDPVTVDHYAALTGYELEDTYAVGLAYTDTMCRKTTKIYGYATSVAMLHGLLASTMVHELGHSMGILHDSGPDCANYIMQAYTNLPEEGNKETHLKFSNCSVLAAMEFFSSIAPRDLEPDCLYNSGVSEEDYLANFCLGFRGTGFTLDEMCKTANGADSVVCSGVLLDSGYVSSCLPSFSFGCGFQGYCQPLLTVPAGTKCTTDGTLGDKICFRGNCVSGFEICPGSPGTTVSTTTGTVDPTTTTTSTTTTTTSTTMTPTTTPRARCRCRKARCCRRSKPPCCRGCFQTSRGKCRLRRRFRG